MGRRDGLVSAILIFLILLITGATIFFCLDIFKIIDIPEQYSIAQIIGSRFVEVSSVEPISEQITEDTIDEWINSQIDVFEEVETVEEEPEEDFSETREPIPEFVEYFENNNTMQQEQTSTSENNEQNDNVNYNISEKAVNRMYYSQLNVYGKIIYDRFYDNLDKLKTGTFVADFDTQFNDLLHEENGAKILEEAFQHSINAMLFDNPSIFYIDVTKIYMSTETTSFGPLRIYRVKIGPLDGEDFLSESFHNEEIVNIATSELERVRDIVIAKANETPNINEKIKIAHDFIISNAEYEQTLTQSNIYTAYGALAAKTAVCEGYAKAFKYLLDELNIPCIIACGIGQNSSGETENHAWNYVKINDLWYAIDCTWDDPVIIGDGYISPEIYQKYFLKGSKEFFMDHFENGVIVSGSNFVYPTISEENY